MILIMRLRCNLQRCADPPCRVSRFRNGASPVKYDFQQLIVPARYFARTSAPAAGRSSPGGFMMSRMPCCSGPRPSWNVRIPSYGICAANDPGDRAMDRRPTQRAIRLSNEDREHLEEILCNPWSPQKHTGRHHPGARLGLRPRRIHTRHLTCRSTTFAAHETRPSPTHESTRNSPFLREIYLVEHRRFGWQWRM